MHGLKGLSDFCRTHKIPIPKGDEFNLLDFLLQISAKAIKLAEYKGSVTEVISRLGEESDEWGGCPRCGSNVHLGLETCPVCGLDLSSDEESESEQEDELSELDPKYAEDEGEADVEDLDELDEDDDSEEDAEGEEDIEEEEDPLDEAFEDEEAEESEEDSEDDLDEFEDEETEDEDDDEVEEEDEFDTEEEPEEDEDELDDEEEDLEPPSAAKTSIKQKKLLRKKREPEVKIDPRRNLMPASQKARLREQRRRKLESLIPKFRKKPELIDRLKYRDLLIMPGLLGYTKRPSMIGKKEDIQAWVKKNLKRKGAKA